MARGGQQYDQYDSWPPPRDYAMEKIQAFLAILPVLISPRRGEGRRKCREGAFGDGDVDGEGEGAVNFGG